MEPDPQSPSPPSDAERPATPWRGASPLFIRYREEAPALSISCLAYRALPALFLLSAVLYVVTPLFGSGWVTLVNLGTLPIIALALGHLSRQRCHGTCFDRYPLEGPTQHSRDAGRRYHRWCAVLAVLFPLAFVCLVLTLVWNIIAGSGPLIPVSFALAVVVGLELGATQWHARSWCPLCEGGGGDDHHDNVPDPDPSKSKHLPR